MIGKRLTVDHDDSHTSATEGTTHDGPGTGARETGTRYGTTVTGQRPDFTSRTATEPTNR